MPLIHIRSLPMEMPLDMPAVLEGISSRFCRDVGVEERHVTVSWDYFRPGHYQVGGAGGDIFDARKHQILVELLVPDFNGKETVAGMMKSLGKALAASTGLPEGCIFIHCRYAQSEMVMEGTEIVRW